MKTIRKNTHWTVVGTAYTFEIVDVYGNGVGNKYTVTEVTLKHGHLKTLQHKPIAEFLELIEQGKIKRIY